jgi:hypothetical protein
MLLTDGYRKHQTADADVQALRLQVAPADRDDAGALREMPDAVLEQQEAEMKTQSPPAAVKEYARYGDLRLLVVSCANPPESWESFDDKANPTFVFSMEGQDLNAVFAAFGEMGGVLLFRKRLYRVISLCHRTITQSGKTPVASWGIWTKKLDEWEQFREQLREWGEE